MSNDRLSIFAGTDEIIAAFFGLRDGQLPKQASVSRNLRDICDLNALVSALYGKIEANRRDRKPSSENWRSTQVTSLSAHNRSPEVLLERAVAMLGKSGTLPGWTNQVPVASGLVDHNSDKRAALDLVKCEGRVARFVELKWAGDNPAYAAFELLRYGLVYLFSRLNMESFGYTDRPLMQVGRVELQVLAPVAFYTRHDFQWLAKGLQGALDGIASLTSAGRLSMGFDFLTFPHDFVLPFQNGAEAREACEAKPPADAAFRVCEAFGNLSSVWPA